MRNQIECLGFSCDYTEVVSVIKKWLDVVEGEHSKEMLPHVAINEAEKSVTVYCDEETFKIFAGLLSEEGQDSSFDMMKIGKIYLKFKHVLKNVKRA